MDAWGNLFIADTSNDRIRRVDAGTGVITTVAGQVGSEGEGPLAQARLADPRGLVLAPEFTLIAAGSHGTVQALRHGADWLETVVGRYPQGVATGDLARCRDGSFGAVRGIAYDAGAGRIFLTETDAHRVHVVTVVDPGDAHTWTIAVLAGDGTAGFADGAAAAARFRTPTGLHLDATARTLYVADTGNHAVRAIDLSGGLDAARVTTVAGALATLGFFGDGGAATSALLYQPQAVTRCGNGDLFIADTGNHRVRRIDATTGVITTVLGDGVAASSGQGSPARDFPVDEPLGLACDGFGNLYVSSSSTVRMLPASDTHIVDGSGPVQSIYGAPPRDTFPAAVSFCLTGLAVVDAETLWVADSCTGMLIELSRQPLPAP